MLNQVTFVLNVANEGGCRMRVNFDINKPCQEELNKRKVEKIMKSTYAREEKEHGRFGDIVREEAEKLKRKEG